MLNAHTKIRAAGFSLVELMIGVVMLGILLGIAAPNFQAWILNSQIRNAAESIQIGLQRARAEAVVRNANVEFVLLDTDNTCEAKFTCSSWQIQLQGAIAGTPPIDSRSSSEGSQSVRRKVLPVQTLTTVTFDNTGRPLQTNLDGSVTFTAVQLDSTILAANESRQLQVLVTPGGNARMCDTRALSTSPTACP
jgi:type IV fimbrial biogenesis protein FimT